MVETANTILLRRANKLLIPIDADSRLASTFVATFNQNLQALGYTLSPEVIFALHNVDAETAKELFYETVEALKEIRGVRTYEPMYPNFPKQVMDATAAELYLNALLHYFSVWISDVTGADCIWLPHYRKDQREPLDQQIPLTVIRPAVQDDLKTMATAIATSNTSVSETDKTDLKWLVSHKYFVAPETIPNKENLSVIGALLLHEDPASCERLFKTATDVLRLATSMSGGDVSLAANTKFRSFTRGERRQILSLLNGCNNTTEDMFRWPKRWLRLGERLHPGEYARQFPNSFFAFCSVRNGEKVVTFNSSVESKIAARDVSSAVKLLTRRAGDFARRLDHLLRLEAADATVQRFREVAHLVSTPVLLQAMTHFAHRNHSGFRVVFPKGNVTRVQVLSKKLDSIPRRMCTDLVDVCSTALIERFGALPALGNTYVDPYLVNYLVPFSQRSASKSLRTLTRGSKVNFTDELDTIRFFIWWKEADTRADLDLSMALYDSDWKLKEEISYRNLRSFKRGICHSGDITSAPEGACEFIDVDLPSILGEDGRYIAMTVHSFTHQSFNELSECFAGWMMRQRPQSGEVFDPRTVVDKIDVTTQSQAVIPFVIDAADRRIIWMDCSLKRNTRWCNNIGSQSETIPLVARAFTEIYKPNLYDLFHLHALARGQQVDNSRKADTVFSVEAGTPFELGRIASEFLADHKRLKAQKAPANVLTL